MLRSSFRTGLFDTVSSAVLLFIGLFVAGATAVVGA